MSNSQALCFNVKVTKGQQVEEATIIKSDISIVRINIKKIYIYYATYEFSYVTVFNLHNTILINAVHNDSTVMVISKYMMYIIVSNR